MEKGSCIFVCSFEICKWKGLRCDWFWGLTGMMLLDDVKTVMQNSCILNLVCRYSDCWGLKLSISDILNVIYTIHNKHSHIFIQIKSIFWWQDKTIIFLPPRAETVYYMLLWNHRLSYSYYFFGAIRLTFLDLLYPVFHPSPVGSQCLSQVTSSHLAQAWRRMLPAPRMRTFFGDKQPVSLIDDGSNPFWEWWWWRFLVGG